PRRRGVDAQGVGGRRFAPGGPPAAPAAGPRAGLETAGLVLDQTALEREPSRVAALAAEDLQGRPRRLERPGCQGHVLAMAATAQLERRRITRNPRQDAHGPCGSAE